MTGWNGIPIKVHNALCYFFAASAIRNSLITQFSVDDTAPSTNKIRVFSTYLLRLLRLESSPTEWDTHDLVEMLHSRT